MNCTTCDRKMRSRTQPPHYGPRHAARGLCKACYDRENRRTDRAEVRVFRPVADTLEDLEFMAETGESLEGACARLGLTGAYVRRVLADAKRLKVHRVLAARNSDKYSLRSA